MKRLISILIAVCLIISMSSCTQGDEIASPVHYYYLRTEFTYGASDSVIAAEVRESAGFENNYEALLDFYLSGPVNTEFLSPFPASTKLHSLSWENGVLCLTLSDSFAQLTGLDLSLACACLGKTCMELTGAEEVVLRAQTQQLDGEDTIIITADSFVLLDEEAEESEPEEN